MAKEEHHSSQQPTLELEKLYELLPGFVGIIAEFELECVGIAEIDVEGEQVPTTCWRLAGNGKLSERIIILFEGRLFMGRSFIGPRFQELKRKRKQ